MILKKSDLIIASILGFIVSLGFLLFLKNTGHFINIAWFALLVVPIAAVLALSIAYKIGEKWQVVAQFGRFAVVGFSNFAIDIGILNILQWITSIGIRGRWYIVFKFLSFLGAVMNSFLWNRAWTFEKKGNGEAQAFAKFFIITGINTIIDVVIAASLTSYIVPPFGLSGKMWSTIAAAIAAAFVMMLNFLSYKFIVFKKEDDPVVKL